MSGGIRQLEERHLANEVTIMQWSPKMDLLAVSNKKGEVALHRLTWQRVWLISPPDEFETVSNLVWRPDGKLLAISYTNSKTLHLIDIENKNIIHQRKQDAKKDVKCMAWLPIQSSNQLNVSHDSNFPSCSSDKSNVTSPTGPFLPSLPSLNRGFSHEPDRQEFLFHTLDILFLGHEGGEITMYVFGMFYCGTIQVGTDAVAEISGGLGKCIWVTCKPAETDHIIVYRLSCPLLERYQAFLKVAQMQANINHLMDYLTQTLSAISEAWETILLEMDEKLTRYEEDEPPGTLAADFLELLMIGTSSAKLANFLLHDLSDKGLKKLGHSIEICYSNIQKLVLKHLNSVGMSLCYQLAEMRGMARFGGDYELLGLTDEIQIINATQAAEAFLAKSSEIQQVINHSMKEYKAFFRWLYVEIAKLTDEKIPSEASKISQQELTFIGEFLLGFDTSIPLPLSTSASSLLGSTSSSSNITMNTTRRKGVNLEKLGQYLRREKLKNPLSSEGSEWASMMEDNECLQNHSMIVKQDLDLSLLQSHDKLIDAIDRLFADTYKGLVNHFSIRNITINCSNPTTHETSTTKVEKLLSTQIVNNNNGNITIAVVSDNDRKILKLFKVQQTSDNIDIQDNLEYKRGIVCLHNNKEGSFTKQSMNFTIIDLQMYSSEYVSLLALNQNNLTNLIQFPIDDRFFTSENVGNSSNVSTQNVQEGDWLYISDLIGNNLPKSFGLAGPVTSALSSRIFVSGQRKVAAILSDKSRKVRLIETEVEPDDDDDSHDGDEVEEEEETEDSAVIDENKSDNIENVRSQGDENESSENQGSSSGLNSSYYDDSIMETSNNTGDDS